MKHVVLLGNADLSMYRLSCDHYNTFNICQLLTSKQHIEPTLQASIRQKKKIANVPGGKKVAKSILDVNNIEGTRVTLTVDDGSDSPQVTTTSDHAQVTGVKLDEVHDLVGLNVQLDGIVHLNQWIGVTDCSSIVGGNERNTLGSNLNASDFAKLVLQKR